MGTRIACAARDGMTLGMENSKNSSVPRPVFQNVLEVQKSKTVRVFVMNWMQLMKFVETNINIYRYSLAVFPDT